MESSVDQWTTLEKGSLSLNSDSVHVWRVYPRFDEAEVYSLLSEEERHRMNRFRFAADRKRFAGTRIALRCLLADYLQQDPTTLVFASGPFGKPALMPMGEHAPLFFNIAHSGERALIAVTRRSEIGVDIERWQEDIDIPAVAELVLAEEEEEVLSALSGVAQRELFYRFWTRREAVGKALGCGLHIDRNSFSTARYPEFRGDWIALDSPEFSVCFRDLDEDTGYSAAVAVEGMVPNLAESIRWIQFGNLSLV